MRMLIGAGLAVAGLGAFFAVDYSGQAKASTGSLGVVSYLSGLPGRVMQEQAEAQAEVLTLAQMAPAAPDGWERSRFQPTQRRALVGELSHRMTPFTEDPFVQQAAIVAANDLATTGEGGQASAVANVIRVSAPMKRKQFIYQNGDTSVWLSIKEADGPLGAGEVMDGVHRSRAQLSLFPAHTIVGGVEFKRDPRNPYDGFTVLTGFVGQEYEISLGSADGVLAILKVLRELEVDPIRLRATPQTVMASSEPAAAEGALPADDDQT